MNQKRASVNLTLTYESPGDYTKAYMLCIRARSRCLVLGRSAHPAGIPRTSMLRVTFTELHESDYIRPTSAVAACHAFPGKPHVAEHQRGSDISVQRDDPSVEQRGGADHTLPDVRPAGTRLNHSLEHLELRLPADENGSAPSPSMPKQLRSSETCERLQLCRGDHELAESWQRRRG